MDLKYIAKLVEMETGVRFYQGSIYQVDDIEGGIITDGYVGKFDSGNRFYEAYLMEKSGGSLYVFYIYEYQRNNVVFRKSAKSPEAIADIAIEEINAGDKQLDFNIKESRRHPGRMLREGKEYKLIIMPRITADVWDAKEEEVVDGSEYTDYLEPRVFVTEDGLCNYVAIWAWEDSGLDGKVTEMAKNPKTKDCVSIEDDNDFYDEDEENLDGKIIVIGSNSADKIDLAPLDSCKYKWTIFVGYEWTTVSKEDYKIYKDQALDI